MCQENLKTQTPVTGNRSCHLEAFEIPLPYVSLLSRFSTPDITITGYSIIRTEEGCRKEANGGKVRRRVRITGGS